MFGRVALQGKKTRSFNRRHAAEGFVVFGGRRQLVEPQNAPVVHCAVLIHRCSVDVGDWALAQQVSIDWAGAFRQTGLEVWQHRTWVPLNRIHCFLQQLRRWGTASVSGVGAERMENLTEVRLNV